MNNSFYKFPHLSLWVHDFIITDISLFSFFVYIQVNMHKHTQKLPGVVYLQTGSVLHTGKYPLLSHFKHVQNMWQVGELLFQRSGRKSVKILKFNRRHTAKNASV